MPCVCDGSIVTTIKMPQSVNWYIWTYRCSATGSSISVLVVFTSCSCIEHCRYGIKTVWQIGDFLMEINRVWSASPELHTCHTSHVAVGNTQRQEWPKLLK